MKKLNDLFYSFLQVAASTQKLGINLIRISILIIFVWIGGLKFWNYEAEGIVPFVANSPFMSFFYTKSAPEYKTYKLKEGEFDQAKHEWISAAKRGRQTGDKRYGDTGRCDRGAVGFGATDLEKEISETRKRGMVLMPFPFFLLVTVYSVRYSGLRRSRFAESGVLPGDRKR